MKKFLVSSIFGLTSLLLINATTVYTGIEIAISKLSVLVSLVLGIPGVITMLILNAFI